MNEVLSKLAETLDISNKGLEKLIESEGGVNYAEVYQVLVREYMFYTLARRICMFSVGLIIIPWILMFGYASITDEYDHERDSGPMSFLFGLSCLGLFLVVLMQFAPIFYPNVNLLLELIKE